MKPQPSPPATPSSSGTLTSFYDKQNMVLGLQPTPYEAIAVANARIYHAQLGMKEPEWTYSRLKGVLVFGMDLAPEGPDAAPAPAQLDLERFWFRLISEETGKPVWMVKIPPGFEYYLDRPFFHVFQARTRKFGFLIDEDDDAVTFSKHVIARTRPTSTSTLNRSLSRHRSLKNKPTNTHHSTSGSPRSLSKISGPTPNSLVHIAHIGLGKEGGFEASMDLDPHWKKGLAAFQEQAVSDSVILDHIEFIEAFWKGVEINKRTRNNEPRRPQLGHDLLEKLRSKRNLTFPTCGRSYTTT
ncbi:hypothetical protein BDN72DRAFT_89595 [Pluteus cervinus]|uniref:Uncharacterized protein n=1 Tax=Pluteus cervinus TaxID=181527 RepID=A0ACD3ANY2_9AGAR|nr:hypothetical protein BDN72DRAFT_89595 [Pluteus cervinus]